MKRYLMWVAFLISSGVALGTDYEDIPQGDDPNSRFLGSANVNLSLAINSSDVHHTHHKLHKIKDKIQNLFTSTSTTTTTTTPIPPTTTTATVTTTTTGPTQTAVTNPMLRRRRRKKKQQGKEEIATNIRRRRSGKSLFGKQSNNTKKNRKFSKILGRVAKHVTVEITN